jgi:prevent-host-death family protein
VVTVGPPERRQQASRLVRRVEAGEAVTITVSGRVSARVVPVAPQAWRRWQDVAEPFPGRADAAWEEDSRRLHDEIGDPWSSE